VQGKGRMARAVLWWSGMRIPVGRHVCYRRVADKLAVALYVAVERESMRDFFVGERSDQGVGVG